MTHRFFPPHRSSPNRGRLYDPGAPSVAADLSRTEPVFVSVASTGSEAGTTRVPSGEAWDIVDASVQDETSTTTGSNFSIGIPGQAARVFLGGTISGGTFGINFAHMLRPSFPSELILRPSWRLFGNVFGGAGGDSIRLQVRYFPVRL